MGCTIAEAQQRIDAPELARWDAYYRLYPPNALNFYIARLTMIVASMFRSESEPAPELKDFLLFGDAPYEPEPSEEERRQRVIDSINAKMSAFAVAWKKNHPV